MNDTSQLQESHSGYWLLSMQFPGVVSSQCQTQLAGKEGKHLARFHSVCDESILGQLLTEQTGLVVKMSWV